MYSFNALMDEESKALLKIIFIDISDLQAMALVDTGATCSILSHEFFAKIRSKYPSTKRSGVEYSKIKPADGSEVTSIKGKLDIIFKVEKHHIVRVSLTVFVLRNCPYDLILG